MAFKIIKKTDRQTVTWPALHFTKSGQAFTNSFFCQTADIPMKDPKNPGEPNYVKFDVLFDEETFQFAIKFHKDGQMRKIVNQKNGQIHFYVKTSFRELGYELPHGAFKLEKVKHKEFGTMWIAQLDKEAMKKPAVDSASKEAEKKLKKVKKHKRIGR